MVSYTRVYLRYLPERYLPNQINIGRVPAEKYLLGTKVPKGIWVRFLANDRHAFPDVRSIISQPKIANLMLFV